MFIAEIGINHKGSEQRALKMLEDLVATGVDAITLQIPKLEFYEKTADWGGPLSHDFYKRAIDFVHKNNKRMGFAVADKNMVGLLDLAGADFYKTLSVSVGDSALLEELQKTKKPLFVSTGLVDESEIIKLSKEIENITFIHTQLSHVLEDANVKAIERLKNVAQKNIAFGLHAQDHRALYVALAFTPSDIFFYVKDKANEAFPDNEHAIVINDVTAMVTALKELTKAVGDGIKKK